MKYLPLVWAALFRRRTRTVLTVLSVSAAFLLFGMLDAVRAAFDVSATAAGVDRLVVASRFSIIQPLPKSLLPRIRALAGVRQATFASWFGGIYQDPKQFFANFAAEPAFFDMYPELELPASQRRAFETTRTGAVVGRDLAEQFGWKIGDKIPIRATIFPKKDGSIAWTFDLVGIFRARIPRQRGQERQLLFRWDYFDEARQFGHGNVGWYIVRISDPAAADRVAAAIDRLSANSDHETKTQTEQAFNLAFVKQVADIGLIVGSIMGAVFFTLLLVTGNTMAQAVRERIPELAVMKTIGFSNGAILALVLCESVLLLVIGGLLGLGAAAALLPSLSDAAGGFFTLPPLPARSWAIGGALMVLIGLLVGALPARRAMRLRIVDALAGR
jgi:putative ABC transport system permease protein